MANSFISSVTQRESRLADDRLLRFDSASSHELEILDSIPFDFDNSLAFAVSCFCNSSKSSGNGAVISKRQSGVSEGWQLFYDATNNQIEWIVHDGTTLFTTMYTIDTPDESSLIGVVAVYNVTDIKLYVNGVLRATTSTPSPDDISNTGNVLIGSQTSANFHDGLISNMVVYGRAPTDDEVVLIHTLGGVVPEALRGNVISHWPLTQEYYFNDSGTLRAWDVVEQYNNVKVLGYTFTQGQGSDVGSLIQLGFATGTTNGDGLITLVTVTGVSNNNLVGYSIPDPFSSLIDGNSRIRGNITSSGGTNINLIVRKAGITVQSINISVAGNYDFDFVFPNDNDSAFEVLLQDPEGNDAGVTFQVNSITIDHFQRGVRSPSHGRMDNFTTSSVGADNPSRKTNVISKSTQQVSFDGLLNGAPDGTAVADRTLTTTSATIVDFGTNDFDIAFSYRNFATISGTTEQQVVLSWKTSLDVRLNGNLLSLVATSNATGVKTWDINTNIGYDYTSQTGRTIKYLITKRGSTFEAYILFGNNRRLLTSSSDTLTAFDTTGVTSVDFFDTQTFTDAQSFGAFGYIEFTDQTSPDTWSVNFDGYPGLTSVFDNKGTSYNLLSKWSSADLQLSWLGESSLPRIRRALNLNGSSEYFEIVGFNPTDENGYTFIFPLILDQDRDFRATFQDAFFSKRGTTDRFEILGIGGTKQINIEGSFGGNSINYTVDLSQVTLDFVNEIVVTIENVTSGNETKTYLNGNIVSTNTSTADVDLSAIEGNAFIGRDDGQSRFLLGRIPYFRIRKGVLSSRQIAETYDNSFFNPLPKDSFDQLIINCDSPFFSENGSNVQVTNFADVFPTVNVLGFTGATTADQLADLLTNIVDLNTLR